MGLPIGWTEGKFKSFIMSQLRSATLKYPPKHQILKAHRTRRGFYMCAGCKEEVPASIIVVDLDKKKINQPWGNRVKNNFVDHIEPVIDPHEGFVSWDLVIHRMFNLGYEDPCDGYQVLCRECHTKKTKEENEERKIARTKFKNT